MRTIVRSEAADRGRAKVEPVDCAGVVQAIVDQGIRDLQLHTREYSGFEEFCQKKWGWTEQDGYRLIECAPVAECNTRVTSIRQAVELAKVEPGDCGGVDPSVDRRGRSPKVNHG
jgi:hypothetical protein